MQLLNQIFFSEATRPLANTIITYVLYSFLPRVYSIFSAPFTDPQMLWILTPLLITMVLMQLYFGRYRQEELGWNTAFGNSIALIFVSVNLLQRLVGLIGFEGLISDSRFYLISAILAIGAVQLILNFFHKLPKKYAFFIGSSAFVNILAFIVIVLVYTQISLDTTTLFASIAVFMILYFVLLMIKYLSPMSTGAKIHETVKKEKEQNRKAAKNQALEIKEKNKDAIGTYFKAVLTFSLLMAVILPYVFDAIFSYMDFEYSFYWASYPITWILILAICVVFMKKESIGFLNFNYNAKARNVFFGLFVGFLVFLGFSLLDYTLSHIFPNLPLRELTFGNFGVVVAFISAFFISIAEETVFRGFILRYLLGKHGFRKAVVFQSLMYSISYLSLTHILGMEFHFIAVALLTSFIFGLINGLLREKFGFEANVSSSIIYRTLVVIALIL
ncbi:MAG: CPBP family intramembrane metalloprotease [Candidatus Nanoarchaeia archaeon]|nr:CPBP family intramembrane metalloprotease [Candidatus Nanoarchaeia archaeon]